MHVGTGADTAADEVFASFLSCPPKRHVHTHAHSIYKNGDALIRAVSRDQTASSADALAFGCVMLLVDRWINTNNTKDASIIISNRTLTPLP